MRSTPEQAVRVRALAGDIVLCSWARHFTLTVPLSTQVYTVLCKSNASEMREFRSLFTRTFQERSRESSSDNSRPFERNFPGTKNAISSNFRYKTKFHDDKRHFTNSVPEISRWTDTTIPYKIYSIYLSYNVHERCTEGFQGTFKLEFRHEQRE